MRVLHIGKYFPPVAGGIETFCGDLFDGFAKSDIHCRMLVHCKPGQALENNPDLIGVKSLGEAFFTPIAPSFGGHMRRQIKTFKPQVLHLHLPNPAIFRLLASPAARRIPWVVNWHSDVVPSPHQWRLRLAYPAYRLLESATLAQAARVLAASQAYADGSAALQRHAKHKLSVLPFGINPRRLDARQPVNWPDGEFKIAAVGRLTYYKGFDILLKAMVKLPSASLLLLGDGQEGPRLAKMVSELKLVDRVTLIGSASDALRNQVIASADCLCLPSIERTEAFGIVLVEAMALGTPVVATNLAGSGVPWVVGSGGHGLLAEPNDVSALATQLGKLMDDAPLRQTLANNAQDNFPAFHIKQTLAGLADLYRELS